MLTKTQLKIISYLLDNQEKPLGIRELGREISTVYYLVQRNIQQLQKRKIISQFSQYLSLKKLKNLKELDLMNLWERMKSLKKIIQVIYLRCLIKIKSTFWSIFLKSFKCSFILLKYFDFFNKVIIILFFATLCISSTAFL